MKKIVAYRLASIILLVITILGILMISTKMPNEEKNGFERTYIKSEIPILKSAILKENLSQISGVSKACIFLAGQNPKSLLILNKDLKHKDTLLINAGIPADKTVPFLLHVDSPMLYLHVNNMKSIIFGRFPNDKLLKTEIKSQIFTRSIQISPSSMVIRGFNNTAEKQIFQKIDILTGNILNEKDIINEQESNVISSDGMFSYEPTTGKIIFVEYLRNRFYCLDTNLNLIYQHRTLDTISVNPITLKDIKQPDGQIKRVPSMARISVNDYCFTDSNNIFIISALRADNESLKTFNTHTAIDIYRLSDGQYKGSISLRNKEKKFNSAVVQNDTLIALYNKEIIFYQLRI